MADILDKKDMEIKKLNEANKRLVEENSNFQIISKGHKELNGELQVRVNKLEKENKILEVKLEKQLKEYRNKGVL